MEFQHSTGSARSIAAPHSGQIDWISVAAPPPAYTIVFLLFDDGSVRRGVWNGKMWWGYDERVRRACELHPLRWKIWTETAPAITRTSSPQFK